MVDIRYSYRHVPTVKRFSQSNKRLRGLMGPFGSGKSSGCVVELIRRAHEQEPGPDGIRRTRWAVIRNTYNQLRDTTIKTFLQWLPAPTFGSFRANPVPEYHLTAFEGVHAEILFRALDRPDHVGNLLSLELTGAWVNEAREVPWPLIDALTGRIGRYPAMRDGGPTWYGIWMDTNPPDDMSAWFRYFEERAQEDPAVAAQAEVFKQPSGRAEDAENLPNLTPNYYQELAVGKAPEWVSVYVDGKYGFLTEGKAVYPEYNDTLHCREAEPVKGKAIRRGWDFGLTPACTFSQLLPSGQWLVFDEMVADSMGADRFSDDVLAHCREQYPEHEFEDRGDPAGQQRAQTDEKTCFEILRGKGINIEAAEQSPALRIEAVKKPLNTMVDGKPAFILHPRCKVLRRGFLGGYQFRRMQTASERYAESPDKNEYSHPHDALQYDAVDLFGGKLRSFRDKWEPIRYPNNGAI